MKTIRYYIVLLFIAILSQPMLAQLRLPGIFSNGMVMQRFAPVLVWGWGKAGEKVKVTIADKAKTVKVGKDGKWNVSMPELPAGGPYRLTVTEKGKNPQTLAIDLFIGDVFLFSGQSNQELPIRRCMDNKTVAETAKVYTNDNIHYLKLPHQFDFATPKDDCNAPKWVTINPKTAAEIAAVSYFVGKEIQEYAKVPVGIINSSVGGTRVEAWMSYANLSQFPEYKEILKDRKYHQKNWVDSVRNAENEAIRAWNARREQSDTILSRWQKPGYDFSSWKPVDIFSQFFTKGKPHGTYWFRTTFHLSKADVEANKGVKALIRLGAMKDADVTFVNRKRVGNTTYEYPPRKYSFDSSILHEGENEVVVQLVAEKGLPNFTKGKLYQLELKDTTILLADGWQMAVGANTEPCPPSTYFVDTPVGLYNAMIHPLGQLYIRGMVWYQGEANAGRPFHYQEYLTAMIDEWHTQFPTIRQSKSSWPSVIVQLAGFMGRHDKMIKSGWCDLRAQQFEICHPSLTSSLKPADNAVFATALDCGEANDIHPQSKPVVGHRIALQLMKHVYGENVVSEGPVPVRCERKDGRIVITFSAETGKLRPFDDGIAHTSGDYELTVDVKAMENAKSSTYGISGSTFCYAHDEFPLCTIYNEDGIASGAFNINME
mgnify:FL=1